VTYFVVCINKHPYHSDPHSRIQQIGTNETRGASSPSKKWTVSEVIAAIRRGDVFYSTDSRGDTVKVVIANHLGREYVKTENDGIQPDNLLAKPECR
jgi:hypothetical protein